MSPPMFKQVKKVLFLKLAQHCKGFNQLIDVVLGVFPESTNNNQRRDLFGS
jgi:hypothetical protein